MLTTELRSLNIFKNNNIFLFFLNASQCYTSKFQWNLGNEDLTVCKDTASFVTM